MGSSTADVAARCEWTIVARTGERFADFAPCVPSIDRHGRVAFFAALTSGGTGIFRASDDDEVEALALSDGTVAQIISHPDINDDGQFCAYAKLHFGEDALLVGSVDAPLRIVRARRETFAHIGPLGPTMNDAGEVAFRGTSARGEAGVFVLTGDDVRCVASAAPGSGAGFHGLPAIDGAGNVVFRAELASGTRAIVRGEHDGLRTLVSTDAPDGFTELTRFPCVNARGDVSFGAVRSDGTSGVFRIVANGAPEQCVDGAPFAGIRGALIDDEGRIVLIATPRDGALGVYDASGRRVVGIGDDLFGARVVDFALNPVSISGAGDVALRLRWDDGRQAIVRARRVTEASPRPAASRST